MSLDFDYSKVDAEKYPPTPEGDINPVTNALIWHTLNVGMGQPTTKPDEWVFRVLFHEAALSPHLRRYDEDIDRFVPRYLTEEEVLDHAGLHTNVTNITRSAFLGRITGHFEADIKRAQRQREKAQS